MISLHLVHIRKRRTGPPGDNIISLKLELHLLHTIIKHLRHYNNIVNIYSTYIEEYKWIST